jgi:hypothetical protein
MVDHYAPLAITLNMSTYNGTAGFVNYHIIGDDISARSSNVKINMNNVCNFNQRVNRAI